MSLVFERVVSEGIGDISYIIGDDSTGLAAVIDPRPDCDAYIQIAREHNVTMRHIIQTHIHEDFVSIDHKRFLRTNFILNTLSG